MFRRSFRRFRHHSGQNNRRFRSRILLPHSRLASNSSAKTQRSFAQSWVIWAPLLAFSSTLLAAATSSEYRENRRHFVEAPSSKDEKEDSTKKQNEDWTKPLTSLFGLDAPSETAKADTEDSESSPGFAKKGLNFIRDAFNVESIPSITASWAWPESISNLQSKIQALLVSVGRGPGSLYSEIAEDAKNKPETSWEAHVRLGDELCIAERAFLRERKRKMRRRFAEYIGVDPKHVLDDDIPIVAIAASGGGYRAMTNTTGSLIGAQETGLLDCTSYIAGISGSCWALGVLYSGIPKIDHPDPKAAAAHIKDRISKTFFDTITLELLTTKPTNKYLLSGLLLKAAAPLGSVSLTDIYGTLISSRLFVPSDINALDPDNLSLHKFRRFVDNGAMPLPIFTAIQHAIPHEQEKPLEEVRVQREYLVDSSRYDVLRREEEDLEKKTRWLWYEFTPYEVGCDELGAWIPSWSFGRRFENGQSIDQQPEIGFTILSGIYASAFCATLKDYFNEAQPLLRQLPWTLYSWIAQVIDDNKEDFGAIHPVVPNQLPNFVKGLDGQLREGSPADITGRDTLGFMDAGAELNIPYYPLLRREVDCIIALDASADSQDLWFTRAEEYATRKGLSTWPKGARWPAELNTSVAADGDNTANVSVAASSKKEKDMNERDDEENRRLAESQESQVREQTERQKSRESRPIPEPISETKAEVEPTVTSTPDSTSTPRSASTPLDTPISSTVVGAEAQNDTTSTNSASTRSLEACSIWIGSSKDENNSKQPGDSDAEVFSSSRFDDLSEEQLAERDGIGIVYMPLIPNPNVPGLDPALISTWRREMDPDETEKLLTVAKLNFMEGDEKIRKLLKAMWQRKKRAREELERTHPHIRIRRLMDQYSGSR